METEFHDRNHPIEAEKASPRRLLIFGQGPIIDREQRTKAEEAGAPLGNEDMNLYGHGLAEAGAILYTRGVVGEIIIMGGRTGGKSPEGEYASESEILARKLEELGVPAKQIKEEKRSANTLENLIYLLEEYIDTDSASKGELDVLGASYHSARIRLLMELFAIPYKNAFASDEVLRAVAHEEKDPKLKSAALSDIEKRLDINTTGRAYWSLKDTFVRQESYQADKIGTEQKDIVRRFQEDDAFSRMLLEVPEYWITYVGKIQNDDRLRSVLANVTMVFPGYLESLGLRSTEKYEDGVSESAYLTRVRETLAPIERIIPNLDEWITVHAREGWPEETRQKLERFHEARVEK